MNDSSLKRRAFHPGVASVYSDVHKWIADNLGSDDYERLKRKNIRNKIDKLLSEPTFLSATAQYYVLFHAHFFKVTHTLENIIGIDNLLNWLKHNPRICIVDVGCGAGSASAAFIDVLLYLKQSDKITHSIDIFCIGIDPNKYAIVLYNQFMSRLQIAIKASNINLEFNPILGSDLQALNQLMAQLNSQRECWQLPHLADVLVMQVNVVSPFSERYERTKQEYEELERLGLDSGILGESHRTFGQEEALAYKQLLEKAAIDRMHVITVGTQDWEERVSEMAQAIDQEFSSASHMVGRLGEGKHKVDYKLPEGCYWVEWHKTEEYFSEFHVDVSTIANVTLEEDEDWEQVKNEDNLKLAWARARHTLLDLPLVDEVEIRLFEANLDANIIRLQQRLVAYAEDVVQSDDKISYRFPKSLSGTRPLGLSRMDEEILSIAIIQRLGEKVIGLLNRSYAYRFSRNYYGGRTTEYLYEYWFDAYQKYINHARSEAQKHEQGVILRVDIKSFFTRIVQDLLLEITTERLSKSQRIQWLLRLLLSNDIDDHEAGLGIVQGNIGSGFYANLYLIDLDARFSPNNEWDVEFYRYVDDMIIIVPNPEHMEEVLEAIRSELKKLGLGLNDEKTEIYTDVTKFLESTANDDMLEELNNDFEKVINPVLITTSDYRMAFRKSHFNTNEEWEYQLGVYQRCLRSIGIFFNVPALSRRIYGYLFNQTRCEEELKRPSELVLPILLSGEDAEFLQRWASEFENANGDWIIDKDQLRYELIQMFSESWKELRNGKLDDPSYERKVTRRLRFTLNRLTQLGLAEIRNEVSEILREKPWLLRNPASIVESLSRQGFANEVTELLVYYSDETDMMNEYMKGVILRSIRFMNDIEPQLWGELVKSSVSNSIVTNLLATETWLQLGHKCQNLVTNEHIDAIKIALEKHPPPINRLRKNYRLIIGRYDPKNLPNIFEDDDYLNRNAYDIAQEGKISNLFDYVEPEVIRKTYYSGKRADDANDEESSPR